MDVKAYIYVESKNSTFCFRCAVEEVIAGSTMDLDFALEQGSTEDGCDMRSTPECDKCGKTLRDFYIA